MDCKIFEIALLETEDSDIQCMHAIGQIIKYLTTYSAFDEQDMSSVYAWFIERYKK